jgi:SAM-dependent methyltransferase
VVILTRNSDVLTRSQRVLHVAPERFLREALGATHREGYVYGDIANPEHYLDVTELPFDDASFDVIICSHVFEHVPDDATAMSELLRVLAPTGWAILDAPVDDGRELTDEDPSVTSASERRKRFGQWDHVRRYGRDYADRLRAAGPR